jgi:hypothetical protein
MTDVSFSPEGPPDTVLPASDPDLVTAVESGDTASIEAAVTSHPSDPLAWAAIGDLSRGSGAPVITSYAYYRVGYHRGLDLLRKHGWKGSGRVRSTHPSNLGFLRCLAGLADMAAAIGEDDEAERCHQFLEMLDPADGV